MTRTPLGLARDPQENHRAATPLELLFDLVFVVAISTAGASLHHEIAHGDLHSLLGFLFTFMAIWWAWMNFTWYASAFDNDDAFHRVCTLIIMGGALILSVGIPQFVDSANSAYLVGGYAVMRIGMVALWLRAAQAEPEWRATATTYAAGISIVQVLWIARVFTGDSHAIATFLACFALELLVPVIAERQKATPFHPHHIAERYGLLVIIVLGEGLVGTMASISAAVGESDHLELAAISIGGLILVFSSWWWYFCIDHIPLIHNPALRFFFAYGHVLVFVALASYGPLIEVAVETQMGETHIAPKAVALCLASCAAAFFLLTAFIDERANHNRSLLIAATVGATAMLIIAVATPTLSLSLFLLGLVSAAQVAGHHALSRR